jgi:mannitol operon repressor
MKQYDHETEIIEKLASTKTLRSFLITAVEFFSQAVDRLIQGVFRKDDYAVRYAVEPLLGRSGPLSKLPVRLKLLYGLGIMPQNIYQDIERLIELRDLLNHSENEFSFVDPLIIESIKQLHTLSNMAGIQLDITEPDDNTDMALYHMRVARQGQVVRSALSLAVASICKTFEQSNPLVA